MPTGSKKLEDLWQLDRRSRTWKEFNDGVLMIMHDQEPLLPTLYAPDQVSRALPVWYQNNLPPLSYHVENPNLMPWLTSRGLASITAATVTADVNLLCHSELNSPDLDIIESQGFRGVYWWSHAAIARDWYRYAQHDPLLVDSDNHCYDFLIYNRAWSGTREYRLKFTDLILESGLVPHCQIAFSPWDSGQHYQQHTFVNDKFRPRHDLTILPQRAISPTASADYDAGDYARCWFDVVQETLFDDQRWHLTEKILRPIACGKPFILLSTPGSLRYLRSYGFRTFDSVIDESYDLIVDPVERLAAVINTMKSITVADRHEMAQALREITSHNRERFFSQDFLDRVLGEFRENYHQARQEIESQRQGKNWLEARRRLATDDQHRRNITAGNDRRSRQDVVEVIRRCRYGR